jgi:hypothetical protein
MYDTIKKNMYGLGVGISTVFEILGHFLFQWGWDHTVDHTYIPSDVPWHKNQGYIWFGVGISTVFEILGHFLLKVGTVSTHMVITYKLFLDTRN